MRDRIEKALVLTVVAGVVIAFLLLPLGLTIAGGEADLWDKKCAMCHGKDGVYPEMWKKKGAVHDLNDPAWQKSVTDEQIAKSIVEGIPDKKMPAYKDKLSTDEVNLLVKRIRAFAPAK